MVACNGNMAEVNLHTFESTVAHKGHYFQKEKLTNVQNNSSYKLRAPVCKNQTKSKFRGKGGKFDFFHILMLDRLGYN